MVLFMNGENPAFRSPSWCYSVKLSSSVLWWVRQVDSLNISVSAGMSGPEGAAYISWKD